MDRLLRRQLKKLGLSEDIFPNGTNWKRLIQLVSDSYQDSDKDRQRLEHSIEVNSEEMQELNEQLKIKVKNRAAQLSQVHNKHKAVLESLADAVITINKFGTIETFNEAAEKTFGYKRDEVEGQNVSLLMPKEDRGGHDAYVAKTSIKGNSNIFHRFRELLGQRKNGELFPIEINVTPFGDERDGFVGIVRDITDRRLRENELLQAKEEAEAGSRAKSKFLASMSHELRTPLNAILGFAELFEYSPGLGVKLKQNAKEIQNAGNHLLQLINEILDMSRIESGSFDLSCEAILVSDLFEECLMLSKSHADKRNITIDFTCEEELVLYGDYTKVKQILLNLISNAIKYNVVGGEVHCRCKKESEDLLLIEVEDTGKGVDDSRVSELFEPFNRLGEENNTVEGTGLGLTITKKLVHLMGGKIGIRSELDKGSCFWISLPRVKNIQSSGDNLSFSKVSKTKVKPSILYIEDNPTNRNLVEQISDYDDRYNFIFSNDAESGIERTLDIKPDLIMMDIDLPGMDGFEALSRIKKIESIKHIPVIAVTAHIERIKSKKMDGYEFEMSIAKPISIAGLIQSISEVLNKYKNKALSEEDDL